MADYVRRRAASIQLSFAAGALGLLAGIGLGRGTEPAHVEAEPVAKKTITINGSNIVDGSVKYQDLNKASIQKGIYLKAQTDRLFLKLSDADARFHKVITNALGDYVKLGDADTRYLKLDALNGYFKLTDADARFLKLDALDGYVKLDTADGRYLKLDALNGYLKLDDANARFLKNGALDGYVKLDALNSYVKLDALSDYVKLDALSDYVKLDALNGYLKLDALNGYLKLTDADGRYLKLDDADARIEKVVGGAGYIKGEDADARYVEGDGSVLTGSQLVGDGAKTLLTVPKALQVDASAPNGSPTLTLTNLTAGVLEYSTTARDGKGGQSGVIDNGASVAILIGLLQPATVQVFPKDGSSVHTFSFSAIGEGDATRVVGQALSGAPPPAG